MRPDLLLVFRKRICRLVVFLIFESFKEPELLLLLVLVFVLKMENFGELFLIEGCPYLVLNDRFPVHLGFNTVEVALKAHDTLHLGMLDRIDTHLEGFELVVAQHADKGLCAIPIDSARLSDVVCHFR